MRSSVRDPFEGVCPFHGNCIEGLASARAIEARTGMPAQALPDGHPVWELVAQHLAELSIAILLATSPEVVVLGGGVMKREVLLPLVRQEVTARLGGYPARVGRVVQPQLEVPGLAGALLLADAVAEPFGGPQGV